MTNPSTSTLIGWATSGANVMLNANTQYRISYQASASSGNVTMHVKVGLAVQPYTSDYETNETLNNGLQTFNHMFTPMNGTRSEHGHRVHVHGRRKQQHRLPGQRLDRPELTREARLVIKTGRTPALRARAVAYGTSDKVAAHPRFARERSRLRKVAAHPRFARER